MAGDVKLTNMERWALQEAASQRQGGWGLYRPKTTARLAERGYFRRAQHPRLGERWQITDAGRNALASTRDGGGN